MRPAMDEGEIVTVSSSMQHSYSTLLPTLKLKHIFPAKENFAKGMYPTLQQRQEFVSDACNYVKDEINNFAIRYRSTNGPVQHEQFIVIISFSFVNSDLRESFRERFPNAQWILVDTKEDVAQERIQARKDHFYKGKSNSEVGDCSDAMEMVAADAKEEGRCINCNTVKSGTTTNAEGTIANTVDTTTQDNSDWEFNPVDFEHVVIDGSDPVEINVAHIITFIDDQLRER